MISNNVNDNNTNNTKSNKIIMKLVIIMIVITIGIRELSVAITIIAKQCSMIEQSIDTHRRSGWGIIGKWPGTIEGIESYLYVL